MLNILEMIILIIILLIIIILLTGIRITLEYNKKGSEVKGCLKILILKKIRIYSTTFPTVKDNDKADDEKDRNIKKLFELAKPCLKDFKNYLKSIVKIIKITKIENHFIFGMTSYADTGKYIGIIWSILSIINTMNSKIRLSAQPSFNGSVFDGYGVNEVDIYPLKIIVPTIRLVLKKEVRLFIRGVLDAR